MLMNNELYHHGIDGQRWGVQHGPPYPLSRSEHRAVVRSQKATEKRNLSYKRSRKFAKRMNDDDLNATIDRLQREETYRNLVSKEKNAKAVKKELNKQKTEAKKKEKEIKKQQEAAKNQNGNNQPKQKGVIRRNVEEGIGGGIKTMMNAGANKLAKVIFDEPLDQKYKAKYNPITGKFSVDADVTDKDSDNLVNFVNNLNNNMQQALNTRIEDVDDRQSIIDAMNEFGNN